MTQAATHTNQGIACPKHKKLILEHTSSRNTQNTL